jgi:hypothetical protein
MRSLYRVVPYLPDASRVERGHPLFVPRSMGGNRVDNPGVYDVLYCGDSAEGAIAEVFGWKTVWEMGMLRGPRELVGSRHALVTYAVPDEFAICDLDDAKRLARMHLRPSRVVTRDRAVTQKWALDIFETKEFAGVSWWSYLNPDWASMGLWETSPLTVANLEVLSWTNPALRRAADALNRPID